MRGESVHFEEPYKVYTAATNIEAQMIAKMLEANDIGVFVEEDLSGASLWAFGTITQFHKPDLWIEKSSAQAAAELIRQFENRQRERANATSGPLEICAQCEECGKESLFAGKCNGTVQECPHCGAFIDVGDLGWDDEFSMSDQSPEP
ncbi:MAG: DUF2007 domain-containing protein [Patescibacteria group bacterium]|nr:DUF2007 domain-containing protein [Patescibacteria group bacterium]